MGEIGFIQTGNTPSTANEKHYSTSGIPWITPSDIYNQVVSVPSRYLSEEGRTAARTAPSDSILVTCIASIGKNALINEESGFNQQINSLTPLEEFDPYFLFIDSYHWSETMRKIAASQTMPIINKTEFSKLTTKITNLKEQQKIGKFFRKIDSAIALHQRKLDNLKKLKSGLLQKMRLTVETTLTDVFWPLFAIDWEQRKLGDFSHKVTRKNESDSVAETFTNSAERGIVSQTEFFDKEISNPENTRGYYVVKNNDFVYNPRISNLAPCGPVGRNKLNRSGIMSPLYTVFSVKGVDYSFLEFFFKSDHWHLFMYLNGDTGARADRFAIKDKVFFDMPITVPKIHDEQKMIGDFLTDFDLFITLHQRT